jgi:hypothetical protein
MAFLNQFSASLIVPVIAFQARALEIEESRLSFREAIGR